MQKSRINLIRCARNLILCVSSHFISCHNSQRTAKLSAWNMNCKWNSNSFSPLFWFYLFLWYEIRKIFPSILHCYIHLFSCKMCHSTKREAVPGKWTMNHENSKIFVIIVIIQKLVIRLKWYKSKHIFFFTSNIRFSAYSGCV